MKWSTLFFAVNTPLEVALAILTYTVSYWFSALLMASAGAGIIVGVMGMCKERRKK